MAGIGTVMFGKALVLAAWGGVTAAYAGWKMRRARKGITLRYDAKRDVHYDPLDRWESRGRNLRMASDIFFACVVAVVIPASIYLWFTR